MEAKIDNYTSWVKSSDDAQLKKDLEAIITNSGFTILNFVEHQFQPQGYTALWLLAESHCALHTFPEENKAYVELSSCNSDMYVEFVVKFNQYTKDGKV